MATQLAACFAGCSCGCGCGCGQAFLFRRCRRNRCPCPSRANIRLLGTLAPAGFWQPVTANCQLNPALATRPTGLQAHRISARSLMQETPPATPPSPPIHLTALQSTYILHTKHSLSDKHIWHIPKTESKTKTKYK